MPVSFRDVADRTRFQGGDAPGVRPAIENRNIVEGSSRPQDSQHLLLALPGNLENFHAATDHEIEPLARVSL